MMKRSIAVASAAFVVGTALLACNKMVYETWSTIEVRMGAAAVPGRKVSLQVSEVRVKTSADSSWKKLVANAGVYMLENYEKADTAIASGPVAASSIVRELQVEFGAGNTITVEGATEPLTVTPGRETVKVVVDRKMNTSLEKVIIEVDASRLVKDEQGRYSVVPIVRIK